jgi:hypothetical protein
LDGWKTGEHNIISLTQQMSDSRTEAKGGNGRGARFFTAIINRSTYEWLGYVGHQQKSDGCDMPNKQMTMMYEMTTTSMKGKLNDVATHVISFMQRLIERIRPSPEPPPLSTHLANGDKSTTR